MKPIVVSAANAPRAPMVLDSASAALPCNRCRLEILRKSIVCSLGLLLWPAPFGGWPARLFAGSRPSGAPERRVAIVVPWPFCRARRFKHLETLIYAWQPATGWILGGRPND